MQTCPTMVIEMVEEHVPVHGIVTEVEVLEEGEVHLQEAKKMESCSWEI